MGVRIIGGTLKGRSFGGLKRSGLRPTSSKVREAIFDILAHKIEGSVFIDLYAGTGAVGMEAMSRGAKKVYFVESHRKTSDELENLLEGCGCRAVAEIVKKKAVQFIKYAKEIGLKADIIFLDPPYYTGELDEALKELSDGVITKKNGIILAEHYSKKILPEEIGLLKLRKTYKYGDSSLSLYIVKT